MFWFFSFSTLNIADDLGGRKWFSFWLKLPGWYSCLYFSIHRQLPTVAAVLPSHPWQPAPHGNDSLLLSLSLSLPLPLFILKAVGGALSQRCWTGQEGGVRAHDLMWLKGHCTYTHKKGANPLSHSHANPVSHTAGPKWICSGDTLPHPLSFPRFSNVFQRLFKAIPCPSSFPHP